MIIFAELFMTGAQHAAFNAAMLQVLAKTFSDEKISVFVEKKHYQQLVAKEQSISRMKYRAIHVVPNKSGSPIKWLIKFINEFALIVKILWIARKRSIKLVYFAFLSPLGQYLVSQYARYLGSKNQQLLITLHGLDILLTDEKQKRIDGFYAKLLKRAFRLSSTHKRYMVLEERVANYLVQQQYLSPAEIIQVSHPYSFPASKPHRTDSPLIFAHLGVARLAKHSQLFFELANHCAAAVREGRVIFQIIGPVLPELKAHVNPFVQYNDQETFLSHEAYQQQCLEAHYAVFFYDQYNYSLTSSGAVMDAIAYRLPMLALTNPVFTQLTPVNGIFPGKLYDQVDALFADVKTLIDEHKERDQDFDQAFVALQHYYSIENVVKQFSAQIKI